MVQACCGSDEGTVRSDEEKSCEMSSERGVKVLSPYSSLDILTVRDLNSLDIHHIDLCV